MVTAAHVLKDPAGLHARVATAAAAAVQRSGCTVRVTCRGLSVEAGDALALMRLDAQEGDTLHVTVEGADEQGTLDAVLAAFDSVL